MGEAQETNACISCLVWFSVLYFVWFGFGFIFFSMLGCPIPTPPTPLLPHPSSKENGVTISIWFLVLFKGHENNELKWSLVLTIQL